MPPAHKKVRRRLLLSLFLYALLSTFLLWVLPPPVHFQFSTDKVGRRFIPATERAFVRLHTDNKDPTSINDYFIERIDLHTGNTKRIPLNPGDKKLTGVKDYIFSRDGSIVLAILVNDSYSVTGWDGITGILRFEKPCSVWNGCEMACTADGSRVALKFMSGKVGIYEVQKDQELGSLPPITFTRPLILDHLQFSLDSKWLLRGYQPPLGPSDKVIALYNADTFTSVPQSGDDSPKNTIDEIIPASHGFWIRQWSRAEEQITLSYLDGKTGNRTTLAPVLSRRLDGIPHILSDDAGHLYLLQSLKNKPDNWQHRTRQTILTWLDKLGFNWETTDDIQLRQISPDGKSIIREQTFAANSAEISPDGQYLILLSQMKNETRYIVYRYPTQINFFHALTWPTIPALLLLLLFYFKR